MNCVQHATVCLTNACAHNTQFIQKWNKPNILNSFIPNQQATIITPTATDNLRKCQVWRACFVFTNFYEIKKFQIHIVACCVCVFVCFLRWMNQRLALGLDMIGSNRCEQHFKNENTYIRTKLCHPFRNGTLYVTVVVVATSQQQTI